MKTFIILSTADMAVADSIVDDLRLCYVDDFFFRLARLIKATGYRKSRPKSMRRSGSLC